MSTVIIAVAAVLLVALLGRGVFLAAHGVRHGWLRGDTSGSNERRPWLTIGRFRISFLALVAVGVLLGAWMNGTFDRALVNVGLNYHECATNFAGGTFCGDDLDAYKRRFDTSYGIDTQPQTYEQCRDEWLDLGLTIAEAQSYCADLR